MTKAVIIDDEQNNVDYLSSLLALHCPQIMVVATAEDANEGEKIILQQRPDIVFLDIQMPGRDGFDLLKSLHSYSFEVIFVTAYDQYGIQAVKFSAIDYLLKPIAAEELKTAVTKALKAGSLKKQNLQLENLLHLLQQTQNKSLHRIALQSVKEIRFVETEKIIHCESTNNYTTFYLLGGEKITTTKPIFEYEEMLKDYHFIRCHQSHLVNKKFIKSWIKEDGGFLLLENQARIPVSKQKRESVRKQL